MRNVGKTVVSIEARAGATRLPGKVLKDLGGRPMLQFLIERIQRAKTIDGIVVATSTESENDAIEDLSTKLGVPCFRGSEDDVLDRVLRAAQSVDAEHVVECWGDNPLLDPELIDRAVTYYRATGADCVGTCLDASYPVGQSLIIFPTRILAEVAKLTRSPVDRENVSNYIYEHPERYVVRNLPCPPEERRPDLRMTVDEAPDFDMVSEIIRGVASSDAACSLREVITFLDAHPEVTAMNARIRQRTLAVQRADIPMAQSTFDIFLSGKDVDLVALSEEVIDRTNWYRWFNDEELTRDMQQHYVPNTRASQLAYFREHIAGDSSKLQLGIVHRASQVFVGVVSLNRINTINRSCDLGVIIGERAYQNMHVFTEAMELMLRHAFESLNLYRVYSGTTSQQLATLFCRVLGFTAEGTQRAAVYKRGRYHDVYLFGLLRSEYAERFRRQRAQKPRSATSVPPAQAVA
jgi:spore coat polysaccharide biosynthesis protein SpsF